MHDLKNIHKLNVSAFLQAAENARTRDGKHVLVSYDGLTVTGYETFTSANELTDKLNTLQAAASASENFKVLLPDGNDIAIDRPQLLDGEPDDPVIGEGPADTPGAPQLTSSEEAELDLAVQQRERAEHVLRAAALRFAQEQQNCETLAEKLKARLKARLQAGAQQAAQQPDLDLFN